MTTMHNMTPQEALQRVIEHREIFHDEMLHIMRLIMSGEMSQPLMAAFIAALRVKKETIGEITAAAQVMREFSTKVHVANTANLVDIVGTGGDGAHTFNISTCSMFVAAAAGATAGADALPAHVPALDLRVDDHPDPLTELARLEAVSRERFVHFARFFATRQSPGGIWDRAVIEAAIQQAAAQAIAPGVATQAQSASAVSGDGDTAGPEPAVLP